MYILVNENNIIVGSCNNLPDEAACSRNGQRIFEVSDSEYTPTMLGSVLEDFDIIEATTNE